MFSDFGKLYDWNPKEVTVDVGDMVRWSWSYPTLISGMKPRVEERESAKDKVALVGGFVSSAVGSKSGIIYKRHIYIIICH